MRWGDFWESMRYFLLPPEDLPREAGVSCFYCFRTPEGDYEVVETSSYDRAFIERMRRDPKKWPGVYFMQGRELAEVGAGHEPLLADLTLVEKVGPPAVIRTAFKCVSLPPYDKAQAHIHRKLKWVRSGEVIADLGTEG
jgi:hypothetical protein